MLRKLRITNIVRMIDKAVGKKSDKTYKKSTKQTKITDKFK